MKTVTEQEAVALLLAGGVGVMPTDTVYGLAACAKNPQAVARMYALKRRERKPGTVIAASVQQLYDLGLPHADIAAVAHLWPAPLSVVLKPQADVLPHLHQGLGDFPVRIPSDERLRSILAQTGPLATTSANLPGQPPAGTLAEAKQYFGMQVDFYIDGGDLSGRLPSTIVRAAPGGIEIIREGAYKIAAKERAR